MKKKEFVKLKMSYFKKLIEGKTAKALKIKKQIAQEVFNRKRLGKKLSPIFNYH